MVKLQEFYFSNNRFQRRWNITFAIENYLINDIIVMNSRQLYR